VDDDDEYDDKARAFEDDGKARAMTKTMTVMNKKTMTKALSMMMMTVIMMMMVLFMSLQELRSMHEEFVKQKSGFQSRIQSRDEEINRLRSQVILH